MTGSFFEFLRLLLGTVIYRPYVYVFFACFLFFSLRQLRARGTVFFLIVAYSVAYLSEFSATRNGFPFGMYVYLDETRTRELWLANIPFWDSLSFVFLSYFSWIAASAYVNPEKPASALLSPKTAVLGGFLMMLLDIVIDPLTILGDRWFLGKIYYYPNGGQYFGVTLTNFHGWWFVGSATLFILQGLVKLGVFKAERWGTLSRLEVWCVWGVYAGVMLFNLSITAWIGEWNLFLASLVVTAFTLSVCLRRYARNPNAQATSFSQVTAS